MDIENMITSAQAVKLIKPPMTLEAFRKAATKEKALREARVVISGLALYDRDKVLAWAESVKGTKKRRRMRDTNEDVSTTEEE